MYKTFYLLLTLTFLSLSGYPQMIEIFPSIDKTDLPDGNFRKARTFAGESLYGYIDGGAELYLEYGFSSAWVTEVKFMGGKYKTEIYKMTGPEEAFGIFSVSKYKCTGAPPISSFTCQTKYQLQICCGSYYISIINGTGNNTDSIASLKIGEAIVRKISEPSAGLSDYLPGQPIEIINQNAILAKGKLGIMNGAPDQDDYFKNAIYDAVVILQEKSSTLLSVKFRTSEDLIKFATSHNWKTESASMNGNKLVTGEIVRLLSETHVLIEIPK